MLASTLSYLTKAVTLSYLTKAVKKKENGSFTEITF